MEMKSAFLYQVFSHQLEEQLCESLRSTVLFELLRFVDYQAVLYRPRFVLKHGNGGVSYENMLGF